MSTDRAVILRSAEDPQAFGELFDRHARTIHRFITRRTDGAVADDVVAETFLRAFERRDRFSADREDALPWLFGIAVNVLRHRRRQDLRFLPDDVDRADDRDPMGAVARRVDAERALAAVGVALRRVPAASRDALLLHVWAELSYEDVAAALQVPVGTVRSRINRARARLRDLPAPTTARPEGDPRGRDTAAPQLP